MSAAEVLLTSAESDTLEFAGSPKHLPAPYLCRFYLPVREQLMFPLQFTGTLGRFDLECTVSGGGRSSQAGALRLAVSRALLSFLSPSEGEMMRQGGQFQL